MGIINFAELIDIELFQVMIWDKPIPNLIGDTPNRWVETGLSCFSICIQCYIIKIFKFVYPQKGNSYAITFITSYRKIKHFLVSITLLPTRNL